MRDGMDILWCRIGTTYIYKRKLCRNENNSGY